MAEIKEIRTAVKQEPIPIGRYIAIGLLFVIFFIGIAYLVFSFTRPDDGIVVVRPTPTPSINFTPGPAPIPAPQPVLLPPPSIPANLVKDRIFTVPVFNPSKVTTLDGTFLNELLVAQDGRGNLLFNNLTHDENFQLQLTRLKTENSEKLARTQNEAQLKELELQFKTRLAQLRTQLQLAKIEVSNRPTFKQERGLIALQQEIELEQVKEQNKQQQAIKLIDYAGQLALEKERAQNQQASMHTQTNAQVALNEQQIKLTLKQMSLTQKRFFAQLAQQRALQMNNQQYALAAARVQADIARAIGSDGHYQQIERINLQAQIDEQLLILSMSLSLAPNFPYNPLDYSQIDSWY